MRNKPEIVETLLKHGAECNLECKNKTVVTMMNTFLNEPNSKVKEAIDRVMGFRRKAPILQLYKNLQKSNEKLPL